MLVIDALFGVKARRIKVYARLGGRYLGEVEHRGWQSLVRECASLMPHSYRDHRDVVLYVDNQVLRPSFFGCQVKRIDMMYDEFVFRAKVVLANNKTRHTCRLPQLDEFVISTISKEQATRIANAIRQQVLDYASIPSDQHAKYDVCCDNKVLYPRWVDKALQRSQLLYDDVPVEDHDHLAISSLLKSHTCTVRQVCSRVSQRVGLNNFYDFCEVSFCEFF